MSRNQLINLSLILISSISWHVCFLHYCIKNKPVSWQINKGEEFLSQQDELASCLFIVNRWGRGFLQGSKSRTICMCCRDQFVTSTCCSSIFQSVPFALSSTNSTDHISHVHYEQAGTLEENKQEGKKQNTYNKNFVPCSKTQLYMRERDRECCSDEHFLLFHV